GGGGQGVKLIVGLGNPGREYAGTRHNVGFAVVDRLAERLEPGAPGRARFHSDTLDVTFDGGEKGLLMKPLTYMNRSGIAVAEAVRFYKLDLADLLVLVDDMALPVGEIRLRGGGSAGGHNGLIDIEEKLGTAEYPRLRIGIGLPRYAARRDWVLGRVNPEEIDAARESIEAAAEATLVWARQGLSTAMNRYNRRVAGTPPESNGATK